MHAQFANHPLFLFCFVLIYCHHQWCYTAHCSVSRADCMLTLHATLRLNGCDAYIFHRVCISRPGQLADNNNVVLLKRFVRPMTHSSTRDTDGSDIPIASIADAIVFAVYMPPHAPAPGHAFRMTSLRSPSSIVPLTASPYA